MGEIWGESQSEYVEEPVCCVFSRIVGNGACFWMFTESYSNAEICSI